MSKLSFPGSKIHIKNTLFPRIHVFQQVDLKDLGRKTHQNQQQTKQRQVVSRPRDMTLNKNAAEVKTVASRPVLTKTHT